MMRLLQTVRFKILLAMGTCLIMISAVGLFGLSAIFRLNQNVSDSYTETTLPILDLEEVRAAQLDIQANLARMQVVRDSAKTIALANAIQTSLGDIDRAWPDYYPAHVSNDDERAVADKIRDGLPLFRQVVEQAIKASTDGDSNAADSVINSEAAPSSSLLGLVARDILINQGEAKQFATDSKATADTAVTIMAVLAALGLAIAIGSGFLLLRAILRPLADAVDVADKIAGGSLQNSIKVNIAGEFGDLLRALHSMDLKISQTVNSIQLSAASVSIASREIASGNIDLSARTEEQAASLEETAATMHELTETVRQNADNARQASGLAAKVADLADEGDGAVHDMLGTIEQICGSSGKISDITGVIEGIAFQTNILALNAAVEAARAGEQGRGFAVVASEVRSLAQRSAAAAKEIKDLIGSSVAMIRDGSNQAVEVGATIGQLKQGIKRVADIVGEIAGAAEEQSRGIEQVNQAVSQMDEVTQQNAALVEQAAAAAQSLEEQATGLKLAASVFRLDPREGHRVQSVAKYDVALARSADLLPHG